MCWRSIEIGLCRAMSGARIAARVITTTIPIPMRARLSPRNLCRCLGSSIVSSLRRWISERRRRVRRLPLPPAMLPEVLRRYYPHPMLQTLRKTCDDRVHITIPIARLPRLDSLDDDPVAAARLADCDDEQNRHLE